MGVTIGMILQEEEIQSKKTSREKTSETSIIWHRVTVWEHGERVQNSNVTARQRLSFV